MPIFDCNFPLKALRDLFGPPFVPEPTFTPFDLKALHGEHPEGSEEESKKVLKEEVKMSEPIYKFFTGRFLADRYQLSKRERESILAKLHDALEKLGARTTLHCNTNWSSDQWMWAGVEEFPNIEAVQKYMATLQELNWNRYVEGNNVLGTKSEP
jgi:hypothetical protein